MRAGVGEGKTEFALDLQVRRFRDHHPAGRGQAFEPRGNVDAIAVDRPVILLDDVAEIDADAEMDAAIIGHE